MGKTPKPQPVYVAFTVPLEITYIFSTNIKKLPLKMSSKRILSVDEDSESSVNMANSDSMDILNSDSDSSDVSLPVRRGWTPLVVEDDSDDEDHRNH
ncbi:unnamed protein product [Xylocopa violacea]|uniref:Uncharacterized protein n=1 Tax=Xylocopa violacea TaxID=135666 RepID=A0ABP1N797_XYLVO